MFEQILMWAISCGLCAGGLFVIIVVIHPDIKTTRSALPSILALTMLYGLWAMFCIESLFVTTLSLASVRGFGLGLIAAITHVCLTIRSQRRRARFKADPLLIPYLPWRRKPRSRHDRHFLN